jgi:hypothetical protein
MVILKNSPIKFILSPIHFRLTAGKMANPVAHHKNNLETDKPYQNVTDPEHWF